MISELVAMFVNLLSSSYALLASFSYEIAVPFAFPATDRRLATGSFAVCVGVLDE